MRNFMSACIGAVLACEAVRAATEKTCSAIVKNDNTFAEFDHSFETVMA